MKKVIEIVLISLSMNSCVSTKKYKNEVAKYNSLQSNFSLLEDQLKTCLTDKENAKKKQSDLEEQIADLKATRNVMINQLTIAD